MSGLSRTVSCTPRSISGRSPVLCKLCESPFFCKPGHLRLGCKCLIHYQCLVKYIIYQGKLHSRDSFDSKGIGCPFSYLPGEAAGNTCQFTIDTQKRYFLSLDDLYNLVEYGELLKSATKATVPDELRSSEQLSARCAAIALPELFEFFKNACLVDNIFDLRTHLDSIEQKVLAAFPTLSSETLRSIIPNGFPHLSADCADDNDDDDDNEPITVFLTRDQIKGFDDWISRRVVHGVIPIHELSLYAVSTMTFCPVCRIGGSRWHGHECHHIQACKNPDCSSWYCMRCRCTEPMNLAAGRTARHCICVPTVFCAPANELTVKDIENFFKPNEHGYPVDSRCNCPICPDCLPGRPCCDCSGNCAVCMDIIMPGPKSLDLPWVPQSQSQRDRLLEIEGARRPIPVASPLGQVGLLLVKLKGRYDEVLALSEKYRRHSDIANNFLHRVTWSGGLAVRAGVERTGDEVRVFPGGAYFECVGYEMNSEGMKRAKLADGTGYVTVASPSGETYTVEVKADEMSTGLSNLSRIIECMVAMNDDDTAHIEDLSMVVVRLHELEEQLNRMLMSSGTTEREIMKQMEKIEKATAEVERGGRRQSSIPSISIFEHNFDEHCRVARAQEIPMMSPSELSEYRAYCAMLNRRRGDGGGSALGGGARSIFSAMSARAKHVSGGCSESCSADHSGNGNCLVCSNPWGQHSGHRCPDGRSRGSWPNIKPEKALIKQFHRASLEGQSEIVREMLVTTSSDASATWQRFPLINRRGEHGRTALHVAAGADQDEVVSVLLENGANVHITDKRGWSALHEAAHASCEVCCELLIAAGASIHLRDNMGSTPRDVAVRNNSDASIRELLSTSAAESSGPIVHAGSMTCTCAHRIGQVSWPLDTERIHLPSCTWSCCGKAWNSPACDSASDSDARGGAVHQRQARSLWS